MRITTFGLLRNTSRMLLLCLWICGALCAMGSSFHAHRVFAGTNAGGADNRKQPQNSGAAAAERDGQHDFDFEIGTWKLHLRRRLHPLTGSDAWTDFEGSVSARKIWDGRADFDQFEAESPTGH